MEFKFLGIFELLRPFTLLAPIIVSSCVMIASFIYSSETNISLLSIVLIITTASICFALLNGASNALNQSTDFIEDKISKPYRPLPRGNISKKEAERISYVLYIFAISLSFLINITFALFIILISVFSITYSITPRMKKFLILNQVWVAIPRGFLGILGSWSVFGDPFQKLPLAIGCIAAIFLFGGTSTKDILDAEADEKAGTKTLVNVFGVRKAAFLSLFFMILSFALIIPLIILKLIEFYLLPLASLAILSFVIFWFMVHNRKNERGENTSSWTLMYATYMIYLMVFAFLTYFYA
jgi:geranylgeranylglycerol-phosphate geranylgeranyltransferase